MLPLSYQGVLSAIRAKGEAGVETIFVGIHARLSFHCVTFMYIMEIVEEAGLVEDHNLFVCFGQYINNASQYICVSKVRL